MQKQALVGDTVFYMQTSFDPLVFFPAMILKVKGTEAQLVVFNGDLAQSVYCMAEHGIHDGGWFYRGEFGI